MAVSKFIHVEVADDLYENIVHAAQLSGEDFPTWIRRACSMRANREIEEHRLRTQKQVTQ